MTRLGPGTLDCGHSGTRRGGPLEPSEDSSATEVGADRRWTTAAWWSALVLVAAVIVSRVGDHGPVILGLGLVAAAAVFVVAVRTKPAVVTRDEVRLPRRTIRRADVASVTRATDSTALVFRDAQGSIVGLADLYERSGKFREALREHGWPEVDQPA